MGNYKLGGDDRSELRRLCPNEACFIVESCERKRIRIVHDGEPFSGDDVDAICNLGGSTKEPIKMLGYLGMGFKSVFRASNEIHIYSDSYRFKFDKKHCPDELENLWMVFPIWIEEPVEAVDDDKTRFLIYLKRLHTCLLRPISNHPPAFLGLCSHRDNLLSLT